MTTANAQTLSQKIINVTVVIASLGYFIDFFDMWLFSMLRVKSLTDLGFTGDAITTNGLFISNCQFAGFLIGAYISGIFGDKYGRKQTLYLSIIIYSLGSLASSMVHDVHMYGLARFVTGIGLAGELGTGVTLILEKLRAEKRGYGILIFINMGFLGALAASYVTSVLPWREAYVIGGVMGLVLLVTRVFLSESGMYEKMEGKNLERGGLRIILRDRELLKKFLAAIFIMAPAVFIPQIIWTLSPELGKSMGLTETIKPPVILGIGFSCVIAGDILAMILCERLRSRKKAVALFLFMGTLVFIKYLFWPVHSLTEFYVWNGLLGLAFGAWVIGAAWGAEHFGVNIRATAATTIPNFARGLTIPMNMAYGSLKAYGAINAAGIIGFVIFALAWLSWRTLSETWGKDLDYYEPS